LLNTKIKAKLHLVAPDQAQQPSNSEPSPQRADSHQPEPNDPAESPSLDDFSSDSGSDTVGGWGSRDENPSPTPDPTTNSETAPETEWASGSNTDTSADTGSESGDSWDSSPAFARNDEEDSAGVDEKGDEEDTESAWGSDGRR